MDGRLTNGRLTEKIDLTGLRINKIKTEQQDFFDGGLELFYCSH